MVNNAFPAIQINAVHKHFGALHALRGVDLTIQQGEFFGLLGPNGAGKSTLINVLAGLLKPSRGSVSIMGHDVVNDYQAARMYLGLVPQELVFDPFFNVREMLRFQAGYFGYGRENDAWVDEVIENLGLTDKANTNIDSYKYHYWETSVRSNNCCSFNNNYSETSDNNYKTSTCCVGSNNYCSCNNYYGC